MPRQDSVRLAYYRGRPPGAPQLAAHRACAPVPSVGQPEQDQRLKESNVTAKYFFTIDEVKLFFARREI
jgi:hypothetical protein